MNRMILIKYGELTTKKGNRNTFISLLMSNMKSILSGIEYKIKKDQSRMYVLSEDGNMDEIAEKLQKVFGIHGIVICHSVDTDELSIKEKVLELVKQKNGQTFKIETKRADKKFPIPSMEFNKKVAGHVLAHSSYTVDVHHPDVLVTIEIRVEGTFIYTDEIKGLGGYPVGVQGKGLLMLSGGIDSPVAGFLGLKRGVSIEAIYFESPPHTSIGAQNKVKKLTSILNAYSGHIKLHIVPFTKLQEAIYKHVPGNYNITIMRRMMYRIAEAVAIKNNCKILMNGESIGQVASQTLDSMVVINEVTNMPVIRPVSCMDKLEIIEVAKKIGTYETSILPFEDCCTIFVPKHPVIHPKLGHCLAYESSFDFAPLLEEAIVNTVTLKEFEETKYEELL